MFNTIHQEFKLDVLSCRINYYLELELEYYPVSFFNPVPQRNCLSTISVNEDLIIDVIKELSCNSAAGPDGVPVSLLKNSSVELAKPLNILFNHSINTGQVPSTWKEAAVVPIYKGGDRSLAKNYRPISLTSAMMKLLERLIRKQLVNFLSVHNLFNPNQGWGQVQYLYLVLVLKYIFIST